MAACGICSSERQDELEKWGLSAASGETSWRQAAANAGLSHHQPLKNHMERHFVAPPTATEQALAPVDDLIAESIEELIEQAKAAPPDLKPLYLSAIHNLRGLAQTKPSQQHLQAALKGIHEITGMKMDQQQMLAYGMARFKGRLGKGVQQAIEASVVVDVEGEEIVEVRP